MSLSDIPRIVLFILAAVALLFAFRALMVGMRSRTAAKKQYFNVGRLEAQRNVFKYLLATVGFVLLAMVLLVAALAVPNDLFDREEVAEVEPAALEPTAETENENVEQAEALETTADIAPAMNGDGSSEAPAESAETAAPPPTATPIPTATPVPTPEVSYVYVDSPIVGLYIRDLPEGDIIDVLDDQTRLGLLNESELINEINWILVRTDDGREGWVAEQFVTDIEPLVPLELPQEPESEDTVEENG
ncbi:MAG: SH3 domain-containing protein [Chloroflexota bacterium]